MKVEKLNIELYNLLCNDLYVRHCAVGKRFLIRLEKDDLFFLKRSGNYILANVCDFKFENHIPLIVDAWFNEKKGVTVVKWADDTITKVTLQSGDVWNKEHAISLCYMKKIFGNNGSYNEILKAYASD